MAVAVWELREEEIPSAFGSFLAGLIGELVGCRMNGDCLVGTRLCRRGFDPINLPSVWAGSHESDLGKGGMERLSLLHG
ncbi:hypothetical protein RchiOBHm_Chr7g0194371 [Rosa chinensis]|uniref:Uncharacterized protein n=1 Tax=Rosa chinensis TaxID=74649 RepID=A0A2P6P622_ROSCH|nr:hypothetical protein RchiOBHm_Chr7g0194371 [Rosa chinensis]